ncbi:MAG: diaminopimelate decarboxylase, partial [Pseudomonadota bacterium]
TGVSGDKIVFSGIGKTEPEIRQALAAGIHQINVESAEELEMVAKTARDGGWTAPVALRVNPDVDAQTHAKITTGRSENKFGIDFDHAADIYRRAGVLDGVQPIGFAVHIGSQLMDLAPYRAAYARLADLTRQVRADGGVVDRLDLGGGIGIAYGDQAAPDLSEFADIVRQTVLDLGCALTIEPGRSLVGRAGLLISRVLYDKRGITRRFLILDAAMNDLIRPAMYEARHRLVPVDQPQNGAAVASYDIVGPVCESGDTFAKGYELTEAAPGDLYAFQDVGAYGAVMASEYNSRPLVPEVLVDGGQYSVIRRRPDLAERLAAESIPHWLAGANE